MEALKYFLWDVFAWMDKVFGMTQYWEMQTTYFTHAEEWLARYIVRMIHYFEEHPLDDDIKDIEVMQRYIENANKSLQNINFKPRKFMETINDDAWLVFNRAWDMFQEKHSLNPAEKHYFDISSGEIRHLLYKEDSGEKFLWGEFFLEAGIIQGKVQFKVDVDRLEMTKRREYEFNQRKKEGK